MSHKDSHSIAPSYTTYLFPTKLHNVQRRKSNHIQFQDPAICPPRCPPVVSNPNALKNGGTSAAPFISNFSMRCSIILPAPSRLFPSLSIVADRSME
mmetsp:Transcript_10075/g.18127  ORF Transcript_10075/g.18127 Transcript_10075/m.18127 type:complete len:97 (-) Transcript_10075:670-960(-)